MKPTNAPNPSSTVTPNGGKQYEYTAAQIYDNGTWITTIPNHLIMDTCPNCGYCSHCGRGAYPTQPTMTR
jgi:hypothetical protein